MANNNQHKREKKIKLVLDFEIDDIVMIVSNPGDPITGMITEIKLSKNEIQYLVATGLDEKFCYASEIELFEKPQ